MTDLELKVHICRLLGNQQAIMHTMAELYSNGDVDIRNELFSNMVDKAEKFTEINQKAMIAEGYDGVM